MNAMTDILPVIDVDEAFRSTWRDTTGDHMTVRRYLELCSEDSGAYSTPHERMMRAIGTPIEVDTSKDERLARIHQNRTIRVYPAFSDFYGMEDVVERVVGFLRHGAQGLEERKQVLYLLGPVGGGKSTLAERLKSLMERESIYVLAYDGQVSPVFESPLGLFLDDSYDGLMNQVGVPKRYRNHVLSPWANKRMKLCGGDLTKFSVVEMKPSRLDQVAIMRTEPGDENNQDISTLVGKVDIRKLEKLSQADPDAYSFSGGLNRANQGVLEFVEMFKAPIKVLHPLLTATQDGIYIGTENIGAIPFRGIVLAHSNESEWQTFKNNRNNEAFLDRVYIVKVPYCLAVDDEVKIYRKMIAESWLATAPCAPETIEIMATYSVMTRMKAPLNSSLRSKSRVYNGESIKEKDPHAKSVKEYRDEAGVNEGMSGGSTRDAFKIIAAAFNYDPKEVAADPVHLLNVLENHIRQAGMAEEEEKRCLTFLEKVHVPEYAEKLGEEVRRAYVEAYDDLGQNMFERYVSLADAWIEDSDFKDPDTGVLMNRNSLNDELEKIEKAASIVAAKDFRNEVVKFVLRQERKGEKVDWKSYEKMRRVIEKRMFAQLDEMLPVISFGKKANEETEKKHAGFVERMMAKGYTERQTRRLTEWWCRVQQKG